MLKKTIFSDGKNDFKDNIFSAWEWSAPIMSSVAEMKERMSAFKLEGRRIKQMKIVGLAYNLTRDWIEESAYRFLKDYDDNERYIKLKYENIEPTVEINRFAEIDEPLLIEFDDSDIFEIMAEQEPYFRTSMNCVPWDIKAGTNPPNADANTIFAPCIGQLIKTVEVRSYVTDREPMSRDYFDENHSKHELISGIAIQLENGMLLMVEGWVDYCQVSLKDYKGNDIAMTFRELEPALFNPEDLQME